MACSHKLEKPFFVLATENPIEMEGTFPLPEAQLDRFMLKMSRPGYVKTLEQESEILRRRIQWKADDPVDQIQPAVTGDQVPEDAGTGGEQHLRGPPILGTHQPHRPGHAGAPGRGGRLQPQRRPGAAEGLTFHGGHGRPGFRDPGRREALRRDDAAAHAHSS